MDASAHLMLVDDDRETLGLLTRFLERHGLRVSTATSAADLFRQLATARIDLFVLDVMLPGEDGLALCRRLRALGPTPIIMLTALASDTDRIIGLELGADDYLAKPFNPRELLARIRAVLRRAGGTGRAAPAARPAGYRFEGWRLDLARRNLVSPAGLALPLSGGELDLLVAFLERPGTVLSRDQLLDLARGRAALPFDRSIDIQVSRLRRKLGDDPKAPGLIRTVRAGGYVFAGQVEPIAAEAAS